LPIVTTLVRPPCDEGIARAMRAPEASSSARRAVLIATVLGSSLAFIDGAVVNIALPALQAAFGASAAVVQWVVNAYLLLLGALVLLGGAAADRYGRRRVFVLGIALFALASLACALAPTAAMLIAARAVQGFAAALMTPASLALLGTCFDEQERARAFGIWAGAGALTTAFGPVLGGWLVDTVGWRAIFLINLPIAAVALAIALRAVPESRDEDTQALDWPGALAAAASLGVLTYGLTAAPGSGWTTLTWSLIAAGVALFGAFLIIEQRSRMPMMPLALYRSRAFSTLNAMTFLLYFALGGALFLLPFELIRVDGYSATAAGAALIPFALVMGLFSSAAGTLASHVGNRAQLAVGPIIAGIGIAWLGWTNPGGDYSTTRLPALLVLAIGMTLTVGPLTAAVMSAAQGHHTGLASGVNNAVARVAGLLAVAVVTLIVAGVASGGSPTADVLTAMDRDAFHRGFRAAMIVAGVCAAVGGVVVGALLKDTGFPPPIPALEGKLARKRQPMRRD
jgi:EmrB/QacA subfamily drug resistance transporter